MQIISRTYGLHELYLTLAISNCLDPLYQVNSIGIYLREEKNITLVEQRLYLIELALFMKMLILIEIGLYV